VKIEVKVAYCVLNQNFFFQVSMNFFIVTKVPAYLSCPQCFSEQMLQNLHYQSRKLPRHWRQKDCGMSTALWKIFKLEISLLLRNSCSWVICREITFL